MGINEATLRLFNGIQTTNLDATFKPTENALQRMISHGYITSPQIQLSNFLLSIIEKFVGVVSGEKANATFHKSWATVRDTPEEVLVIQQIVHYITTYGFERLGIYSEDTVYLPKEELNIPDLTEDLPLVVIKAFTSTELLEKIIDLGSSGVALSGQVLEDIRTIIYENNYDPLFIDKIKNRELMIILYDFYGTAPSDPIEYLRYLVYRTTAETLLIKNKKLIGLIKETSSMKIDPLLKLAPQNLAEIFFRFKPIFLAFKAASRNKNFFNRLRKNADKMHRPLPVDYMNSITNQIKLGRLDSDKLIASLKNVSIYRKIRLAQALMFRLDAPDSIVYRIRNGKGWVTDFDSIPFTITNTDDARAALHETMESIIDDMRPNVEGQRFYIPSNIVYALPATEKQFLGNLPNGSYIDVDENMIFGIHWENLPDRRVDLDLSFISQDGKYGWDALYRSGNGDILFSGDITDAPSPKGATECFYINGFIGKNLLMMLNYYNYSSEPVPCTIFVASRKMKNLHKNYMVDPNNILMSTQVMITQKSNTFGIVTGDDIIPGNAFHFTKISIGNSITSSSNDQSSKIKDYLVNSTNAIVSFNYIVSHAGAIIINEKPDDDTEFIDLSPQALDKSSILSLMQKKIK